MHPVAAQTREDAHADELTAALTPTGRIDIAGASPSARAIRDAFAQGRGAGILHLALTELHTTLHPTLAYWRELGKTALSSLCAALDPLEPARVVITDPDPTELEVLALAPPPMLGAELITAQLLAELWREVGEALAHHAAQTKGGAQAYLEGHGSVWNVVGRVCLHLAENKGDPEQPFAFMATYVDRVSRQAKAQHRPLGHALQHFAGEKNKQKLLALLQPLARAAQESELIAELLEEGEVYHPLRWTAQEAHRFLRETHLYERAGLVVRIPNWWSAAPRPRIVVAVGSKAPAAMGADALVDFDASLTLGGETLTEREVKALLAGTEGLVLLKGRWVEVDREKLRDMLHHWRELQRHARAEGIGFGQAMRLLAGTPLAGDEAGDVLRAGEAEVMAGAWLEQELTSLRDPSLRVEIEQNAGLSARLRPYQQHGVQWLWTLRRLRLGGCLSDDMGLGKTIQVLGVLSMCRRRGEEGTDLLVVPTSLLDNWRQEIAHFAPSLRVLVAHASHMPKAELAKLDASSLADHDLVITTYGTVSRTPWLASVRWRNLIIDEAQAIKNPGAKQTAAIKSLSAGWRLALTGTPVENRLGDLWSLFDFLNPGLLGSAKEFGRLCKAMDSLGDYGRLRRLVQPYLLRRLKTDKRVITDLPDKSEVTAYCGLSKLQAALYEKSVKELKVALTQREGIARRGVVLAFLMRFKQICNHPSQWLGDGEFKPSDSGKLARLAELCEVVAARQDKVLVFTQFREITEALAQFMAQVFGREGLVLHGGTPAKKRTALVSRFQEDDRVPFMVLSLKAGGTGLNLTAANHVVHFDRWWNPAVEDQATDRAFRIGQHKNVLVHKFVCRGTVEERIDDLIAGKRGLSREVLSGGAEAALTELSNEELLSLVSLDLRRAAEA